MKPQCSNPLSRVQSVSESVFGQLKEKQPKRKSARLSNNYVDRCSTVPDTDTELIQTPTKQTSFSIREKSVRNNSSRQRIHRPAELFRTDFITAMKLPDHELLTDFFLITDQWKLEYEKGIQVPVNENINIPNICYNPYIPKINPSQDFTPIPEKLLCHVDDKNFDSDIHEAYTTSNFLVKNNQISFNYDFDERDAKWLEKVNQLLSRLGEDILSSSNFEKLIELFEMQSNDNLNQFLENFKNYSIEFDETVVCDVCRSPDSECSNEMVFCDGCNICVHQACYGIEKIPVGPWLCGPCEFGGVKFKPSCLLCPNQGGALKPTRNLRNWCHVSCALWIPEVGFGNPLKLEPIKNTSKINPARWQLTCSLCMEKVGCCIQCSEKKCHTSFHITCAFKNNLLVEQTIGEDGEVVFRCFCKEHSRKNLMMRTSNTEPESHNAAAHSIKNCGELNFSPDILNDDVDGELEYAKKEKKFLVSLQSMPEADRKFAIMYRLKKMYTCFYRNISLDQARHYIGLKTHLAVRFVFNYWKMKRRHNIPPNKALIYPRNVDDIVSQTENVLQMRKNMFMHLRHDLERLRNLSYLVSKREKLKRAYFELDRECFQKQVEYLNKYKAHTGNQYHSEAPSLIKPVCSSQSSYVNSPASSHRSTNFRIRDILQFKNEKCIYDFPEKWTVSQELVKAVISKVEKPNTLVFSSQNASKQIKKKYNILNTRKRKKTLKIDTITDDSGTDSLASTETNPSQKSTKTNIKDISINILNNNSSCDSTKNTEQGSEISQAQTKENRRRLRNENSKNSYQQKIKIISDLKKDARVNSLDSNQQNKKHELRSSTIRLRQNEVSDKNSGTKKYNYRATKFRLSHNFHQY